MTKTTLNISVELDQNPKFLYRYRPFNKNSLSELITGQVWFSDPRQFNDPYELRVDNPIKPMILQKNGVLQSLPDDFNLPKDLIDVLFEELQKALDKIGIVCFSTKPDQHLMWSHYADSHKGFCLEYERDLNNVLWQNTWPVQYISDRIPIFKSLTELFFKILKERHLKNEDFHDLVMKIVYSKHDIWAYEDEWRLLDQVKGPGLGRIPAKPKSIIYGREMPVEHREVLWNIFKDNKEISLKECKSSNKADFSMEIIEAVHFCKLSEDCFDKVRAKKR